MWDNRYRSNEYVYGTEPNAFYKQALNEYKLRGKILLPAEGEGRNAVYAAKRGMEVVAFDISEEGKKKALQLAKKENVPIRYEVGNFLSMGLVKEKFDAAALIFAHFPPNVLSFYHQKIASMIKAEGFVILEGFSKNPFAFKRTKSKCRWTQQNRNAFFNRRHQKRFPEF